MVNIIKLEIQPIVVLQHSLNKTLTVKYTNMPKKWVSTNNQRNSEHMFVENDGSRAFKKGESSWAQMATQELRKA